ncbi:hypothetical protein ACFVH6_23410 [Spirillospora sp. NPDC127200]
MTSKERFIAESELREAEREFDAARRDVRSAARAYERCRSKAPNSSWAAQARGVWNLNVMEWISKAIVLEEALEKARALGNGPGLVDIPVAKRQVGLEALDGPEDAFEDTPLLPLKLALDQLDQQVRERLDRTSEDFNTAAETVRQARAATNRAYALYRANRGIASQEQVDGLREAWRSSLITWSQALRDREKVREKTLAALLRAGKLKTTSPEITTFTDNISDYVPDDPEPDDDTLF